MKLKTFLLIMIIPIGLAVWWGLANYNSSQEGLPPLHSEVADRGDIAQRVVAFGSLQPVQKVTVGSQVSGIIDDIYVDFNSQVRRGQLLARIDPQSFEAALSSAQAELESAEAGLELARLQWERVQLLRERQFVTPSEVEQANVTLKQAEAQVRIRRHALDRAQLELDRCTIYSPTDGIVISRNVDVGQTVAASLSAPELFELATDLKKMHIHAYVSEADIGRVAEGYRVMFKVDAYRERDFIGEVVQVRNAPVNVDNVVNYETIISINNEDLLLKPGMTAEVNIITAEKKDVIRVRNTALRARLPDQIRPTAPEASYEMDGLVYVMQEGHLIARRVKTGLSDGVYTEILSGIEPGDRLAVGLTLRTQGDSQRRSLFSGDQATF